LISDIAQGQELIASPFLFCFIFKFHKIPKFFTTSRSILLLYSSNQIKAGSSIKLYKPYLQCKNTLNDLNVHIGIICYTMRKVNKFINLYNAVNNERKKIYEGEWEGGKIRICLMKQLSNNKSKERESKRGKIIVGKV
jgi:hypothetical protein